MKNKNLKKLIKKGFSLAETLLALSAIGIFLVVTVRNLTNVVSDGDVAKFKKAYAEIESAVNFLINDETIYGTAAGFKETDSVTLDKVGEVIGQSRVSKFRDGIKYHLHYVEDKIDCRIYNGSSSSGCFKTDNGVVWGIPDTDFVSKSVITLKDGDGDNYTAVPVTFYLDYKKGNTVENDGFVAAVTYKGKITLINTEGVKCTDKSTQAQCKFKKYIQATTIRKTDD